MFHIVGTGFTEKRAASIERLLIRLLKKRFNLLNVHNGGSGFQSRDSKSGFVVRIKTLDGENLLKIVSPRMPNGKLSISPTLAGRKVAAILANYRPIVLDKARQFA